MSHIISYFPISIEMKSHGDRIICQELIKAKDQEHCLEGIQTFDDPVSGEKRLRRAAALAVVFEMFRPLHYWKENLAVKV